MVDAALYGELQALCRRALPERLDQRIAQIETLDGEGGPSVAFSLSWREGRRPRVERLLLCRYEPEAVCWAGDDGALAQRAWQIMRWLYGLGWPVPPVYAVEEGGGSLLLSRPEGTPLLAADGADPGGAVARLAGLLADLHHLPPPEPVRAVLADASRVAVLGQIRQAAAATGEEMAMEAVRELQVEMEGYPPCVVHGDVRLDHVCCDARGLTALLGWESAALGDPRWDVACAIQGLQAHQAGALAGPFCQAYAERGGRTLEGMPYWEALAALHTWVCARRTTDQGLPWRERTRQALERWRAAVKQAAAAEE